MDDADAGESGDADGPDPRHPQPRRDRRVADRPPERRTDRRPVHEVRERERDGLVVAPGHYRSPPPAEDGSYTATLGVLRERIVAVNLGRESADDEEVFEMELGPNNCAAAAR